nr:hypothetical protein [Tanacetum cinerariifolium]
KLELCLCYQVGTLSLLFLCHLLSYALGVENHYMVSLLVDGVHASGVVLIYEMEFVRYVIRRIHALTILIRILSITLLTPTILHTPHTRLTQPQFSLNYESEPGYNENYNSYPYDSSSLPQQYLCCARCGGPHETCHCDQLIFDEPYFSRHSSTSSRIEYPRDGGSEAAEQWAYLSNNPSKRLHSFCFDADDDEDYIFAITPDEPVLSTEEPDNSLSMGDEHLDTISATESNEFIKSGVENLIPILSESEGIPEHVCDVPSHDNSLPLDVSTDQIKDFSESNKKFSSIDDDSFFIDDIDYVEASPSDSELVSSEVMEIVIPKTKSSSTSLNSLLEETNTFDNSLPEFETFCFDVKEISSGSTTTHPDISLSEYEAFHDDHAKKISSGSPTTHSDSSLYALFIFDHSINPFPPVDRSDSYEFTDELIPFISPP